MKVEVEVEAKGEVVQRSQVLHYLLHLYQQGHRVLLVDLLVKVKGDDLEDQGQEVVQKMWNQGHWLNWQWK
jgi:hypothetical protein